MYPGTHALTTPDKPAVIMAGSQEVVTYRDLDRTSAQLAVALHDLGLRKGDAVAMLSDNAAECFTIYWAALRSGLYLTAINYHLTSDEAAYIARDCDAKVLIASARLSTLAGEVRTSVSELEYAYAFGGHVEGFDSYEELLASAGERRPAEQPRGSDMLYSSGTTGRPKPRSVDQPAW